MENLYRFHWDCGRMGFLDGVFIATPEEVEDAIGKEIYFGEVLGKHSNIHGVLRVDEIKLITDDQDFVEKCKEYKIYSGYNPLEYLAGRDM